MRTKTLMFLITYRCNLRCSYCYEPKVKSAGMSKSRLQSLILEKTASITDEYDSFEIHFMGGEPLLEFPLIRDISEWIWNQRFSKELITIYAPTNGTLLSDEIKEWCVANKDRFCLGLSFDGDESMQDINRYSSSRQVDVNFFSSTWPGQSVKMTISPQTVGKLAEGVKYLHSVGFKAVVADLAQGRDIGWNASLLKEFANQLDVLSDYYVRSKEGNNFSMLDMDIFALGKATAVKSCSCGEDLCCVDVDGQEYACHLFSPVAIPMDKAKNAQNIDFKDISRFQAAECQKCLLNNLCNHCYGMNYISTGDITKADPVHCAAFKIMYIANCKHRLRLAEAVNDMQSVVQIAKLVNLIA